jgi:uncharacterized protein
MKLLCLSDIHGEVAGLRDIAAGLSEVDVVIVAGDITHLGGYAEADAVLASLPGAGPGAVGPRLFAVAGNMDREGVRQLLGEKGIDLHGRGVTVGGIGFMGLGGGTPSPFGTPWELEDQEAGDALAAARAAVDHARYKVLVSHAPPRGTRLDRSFTGLHVGSRAVRDFLLASGADLCISGHIHESPGEDTLGHCHCVNLGPFKNGRYALITIEESRARVDWRKR